MTPSKDDDALWGLHRRLLDGDPLASEESARLLLVPMVNETQSQYPRLDRQLVNDAVVEAILDYLADPSRVGSRGGKGGPRGFVKSAAWRNAANLYRSRRRREVRDGVWLRDQPTSVVEDDAPLGMLVKEEDAQERDEQVTELNALLPDERDRAVLRLRLAGERKTKAFVEVLGIAHLPVAEQRRIVKQTKDRIDKIIRRRPRRGE